MLPRTTSLLCKIHVHPLGISLCQACSTTVTVEFKNAIVAVTNAVIWHIWVDVANW